MISINLNFEGTTVNPSHFHYLFERKSFDSMFVADLSTFIETDSRLYLILNVDLLKKSVHLFPTFPAYCAVTTYRNYCCRITLSY